MLLNLYHSFFLLITPTFILNLMIFRRTTKTGNDEKWLDCNKLSRNANKTNFVILHSPRKLIADNRDVKLGDKLLKSVKCLKLLSILLDEHLSFKNHIQELQKSYRKH